MQILGTPSLQEIRLHPVSSSVCRTVIVAYGTQDMPGTQDHTIWLPCAASIVVMDYRSPESDQVDGGRISLARGGCCMLQTNPVFVDSLWEMFGPLVAGEHPDSNPGRCAACLLATITIQVALVTWLEA